MQQAGAKFIIIMFICMNIMTLFFSIVCAGIGGVSCVANNNVMLNLFFGSAGATELMAQQGLALNPQMQTQFGEITNEQTVGTIGNIAGSPFSLLDGLKMIIGFLALLTPLPLFLFVNTVGLPLLFSLPFFGIAILIWIFGLMEFIRGARL